MQKYVIWEYLGVGHKNKNEKKAKKAHETYGIKSTESKYTSWYPQKQKRKIEGHV